jgi:hypothetical protein
MATAFILGVVALSSAAAMLFVRGRPHRRLGSAIGKTLETVGIAAVFLFLNVGLGFGLALVARAVGGGVSLYVNDDVAIVVLSLLQALVVQWWREPEER